MRDGLSLIRHSLLHPGSRAYPGNATILYDLLSNLTTLPCDKRAK